MGGFTGERIGLHVQGNEVHLVFVTTDAGHACRMADAFIRKIDQGMLKLTLAKPPRDSDPLTIVISEEKETTA